MSIDFQNLFESAPDLYLLLSPDLIIAGASNAYLKATFTERQKIVSRHLFDVFPDNPEDASAIGVSNLHSSLNLVKQYKQPHAMAVQRYAIPRQDGTFDERFWQVLNTPVFNSHGELIYIIHKVEDITASARLNSKTEAQRQTSDEPDTVAKDHPQYIRQQENLFFKIFDLSPVSIHITDVEHGKLMHVNKAFENLFQFRSEEVIGKTTIELKMTSQSSRADTVQKIHDRSGRMVDLEIDLSTADGTVKNMLLTSEIIEINQQKCFLVAMVDITGKKKQQDAIVQLNKELEAFTYSVSHDLRAPLRAISGYSRMLEEDYGHTLDDEARRLLGTIEQNAVRMGQLIDNLLAFSRIGRKGVAVSDTDMNQLVADTIAGLGKARPANAEIIVKDLHRISSDHGLMYHVLINLLSNALKYSSGKERPLVEISSVSDGNEVTFSVKDNGAGFDMRYANKLFGVFQRLHGNDEFEGTGVGLAIVQRIISKHGGRVWAEGKVNEGATFYFSIPLNHT